MKAKLRLDKATLQEFFLQHVEKIVLGLIAIVFLYLVYSAIPPGVERYGKTPEDLKAATATGQRTFDATPPKSGLTVQDYDVQAKQNSTPIEEKRWGEMAAIEVPVFPKAALRFSPKLFAVQDLRGTAGLGAVQMTAEPPPEEAADPEERVRPPAPGPGVGGMETRGQRWIVVTGLVPIEEQIRAFAELRSAGPTGTYDPVRDYPEYLGYNIQRLEVNSPGDAVNPNWDNAKTIRSFDVIAEATKQWGQQQAQDVVGMEYLLQQDPTRLVFPLPPLMGTWDKSVAHPKEIPLQEFNQSGMGMGRGGAAHAADGWAAVASGRAAYASADHASTLARTANDARRRRRSRHRRGQPFRP